MRASILARATLNFLLYLNSPLVYKVSIVHHLTPFMLLAITFI